MPHPGRMTTQKAKDFKGTMRSLLAELGHYKFRDCFCRSFHDF